MYDEQKVNPTYADIFGKSDNKRGWKFLQKRGSEKVSRKNDVSLPPKDIVDENWMKLAKDSQARLLKRAMPRMEK